MFIRKIALPSQSILLSAALQKIGKLISINFSQVVAEQEVYRGNWGIRLKLLVGAVYAIKVPYSKQIKIISILCKEDDGAYLVLQQKITCRVTNCI